jgi:hypothetical protein
MCKWGNHINVKVKIPPDLSSTGKEKWKDAKVDACIAPIVRALQEGGVDMRGCCCGHESGLGDIDLQDGRVLLVVDGEYLVDQVKYLKKIIDKMERNK